jgi:mannose-6-phosphate isomerase-like protein (cupin superfamily)
VVVKGTVTYRYADREEHIGPGEAYYAPPGHTPVLHAGTEVIEFSPTVELRKTMAIAAKNAQAGSEG